MTVFITFSSIGLDAGLFNLYSNVDGFSSAFSVGISRTQLLAGFASFSVPNGTTIIRAKSFGVCTNYVDLNLLPAPTSTTTTTSTTTLCPIPQYQVTIYNCNSCTLSGGGGINNNGYLTIGKFYLHPILNLPFRVDSLLPGCASSSLLSILDSSKKDSCAEVICTPTTTTTTTTVILNSSLAFTDPAVLPLSGTSIPYPDGGGTFNYATGACSVAFNLGGSNFVNGDILTIRFQSFSTYAIRQCCYISYPGTVSPSSIQIIPIMGTVDIDVTYDGINNNLNAILYTPTDSLQPTSSASSSMTLIKRNGVSVTFPPTTDSASLVTPTTGAVTLTIS